MSQEKCLEAWRQNTSIQIMVGTVCMQNANMGKLYKVGCSLQEIIYAIILRSIIPPFHQSNPCGCFAVTFAVVTIQGLLPCVAKLS